MTHAQDDERHHVQEVRLFLEEVCCHLCRFQHVEQNQLEPELVEITPEVYLGQPGLFADIKVQVPGEAPYFIEVKYGYPSERIVQHLKRKYCANVPGVARASKVVLVVDTQRHADWPEVMLQLNLAFSGTLKLEVWDEERLAALIRSRFGIHVDVLSFSAEKVLELKEAIDRANGEYAFGTEWTGSNTQQALLWHFSHWRLHHLRQAHALTTGTIIDPGMYQRVGVVMADLCAFSCFVRDTTDDEIVRRELTSFYSKARYAVLNTGGMFYQFVGDEIIGLYGIPDRQDNYLDDALRCARALRDIGNSVMHDWQRQIDRVQTRRGVHIGMTLGEIQIVSLRPFGRAHLGAISDCINMGARLLTQAGPDELVICNSFYQALDHDSQAGFEELEAVEAKNLGSIRGWKTRFSG